MAILWYWNIKFRTGGVYSPPHVPHSKQIIVNEYDMKTVKVRELFDYNCLCSLSLDIKDKDMRRIGMRIHHFQILYFVAFVFCYICILATCILFCLTKKFRPYFEMFICKNRLYHFNFPVRKNKTLCNKITNLIFLSQNGKTKNIRLLRMHF